MRAGCNSARDRWEMTFNKGPCLYVKWWHLQSKGQGKDPRATRTTTLLLLLSNCCCYSSNYIKGYRFVFGVAVIFFSCSWNSSPWSYVGRWKTETVIMSLNFLFNCSLLGAGTRAELCCLMFRFPETDTRPRFSLEFSHRVHPGDEFTSVSLGLTYFSWSGRIYFFFFFYRPVNITGFLWQKSET